MNSEVVLDDIQKCILSSNKIIILTHESPDGDAVGSSLAMYNALKKLKKDVDVIVDDYSKVFDFLPCSNDIKKESDKKYDLVIALDCANEKRLYDPSNLFKETNTKISIDHHASNTYFADYNYVEGSSPAVCQVLVKLFKKLNVVLDKDICECLISGLITDTGGFRYNNVNQETFELAIKILDIGVNISDIYIKVFQTQSKPQFKLHQIATSRIELLYNDKIAFTYITKKDEKKCRALKGDHEGIVNIGQSIEGVEVSVFLHEFDDGYKVSLRSNNDVNVSVIAEAFDGGGHVKAAGCYFNSTFDECKKKLIREIKKYL